MSESDLQSIKVLTDLTHSLHIMRRTEMFVAISGKMPAPYREPNRSIDPVKPRRPANGEGVDPTTAAYWLDHCERLTRKASDFDFETRRGLVISSRLTGLGWNDIQRAIGATAMCGAEKAATVWAAHMSPPDSRYIGQVYLACPFQDDGIWKVGFTTDLAKRLRTLSRTEGKPIIRINSFAGTMLNEWALHMELLHRVKPEWYPHSSIPSWLYGDNGLGAAE